jgi:hypothetical protein
MAVCAARNRRLMGPTLVALPRPLTGCDFESGRMPGHPEWHLAPCEMAWEGRTVAEICVQLNDPAQRAGASSRNSSNIGEDALVGWAWAPGAGRSPAPGTKKHAGPLVEA